MDPIRHSTTRCRFAIATTPVVRKRAADSGIERKRPGSTGLKPGFSSRVDLLENLDEEQATGMWARAPCRFDVLSLSDILLSDIRLSDTLLYDRAAAEIRWTVSCCHRDRFGEASDPACHFDDATPLTPQSHSFESVQSSPQMALPTTLGLDKCSIYKELNTGRGGLLWL